MHQHGIRNVEAFLIVHDPNPEACARGNAVLARAVASVPRGVLFVGAPQGARVLEDVGPQRVLRVFVDRFLGGLMTMSNFMRMLEARVPEFQWHDDLQVERAGEPAVCFRGYNEDEMVFFGRSHVYVHEMWALLWHSSLGLPEVRRLPFILEAMDRVFEDSYIPMIFFRDDPFCIIVDVRPPLNFTAA